MLLVTVKNKSKMYEREKLRTDREQTVNISQTIHV